MVRLDDLIGNEVVLSLKEKLRSKDAEATYHVILHGVETGGLWIECRDLDEIAAALVPNKRAGLPSQRPVFFVPYSQIVFLVSLSTRLDEPGSKA